MTKAFAPSAAHAVFAPSSASRWIPCTASAEAIAALGEQEEGDEAAEGTRAHDEIERVLGPYSGDRLGWWLENPKTLIAPLDEEHSAAYGIALVLDYVRRLNPGTLWIEQRVRLTDQIWGRCDVAHFADGVLTIVDYKNGQRAVDVEENEQLRIYAAASIATHNLPVRHIRYAVVQPNDWRPFVPRVKQWDEPAAALLTWAQQVAAIPTSPKSFTAGDHCRDCPLFGKCSASQDVLANVGALLSGIVQPADVRPEQVAGFLAMQKPIEDAYKNFKKYWEGRALKTGTPPIGMKIVSTAPHRAWTNPEAARALVVSTLGVGALDVPTPAQAIERGLAKATVHEMAPKPKGGPALAFESDKRPAWQERISQDMFASLLPKS